jgi:hypothetical protein
MGRRVGLRAKKRTKKWGGGGKGIIVEIRFTENVHHGEAVVEGEAEEEAADGELPEAAGEDGGDAGYEADEVRADEGGDAPVAVGHPSEYQPTEYRTDEEDALSEGGQGRVLADPLQLYGTRRAF